MADRFGEQRVNGAPLLAVSFTDADVPADLAAMAADGLDVAELRIDRFVDVSPDHVAEVAQRFATIEGVATLATVRSADEGGEWPGTAAERLTVFEAVIPLVDAIDIELESTEIGARVVAAAKAADVAVIVSMHDFDRTPPTDVLDGFIDDALAVGADLVKLAVWAETRDDLSRLAQLTIDRSADGVIVLAMGRQGPASRIFFGALGSRITYAHGGANPLPGQLSFAETRDLLRVFYPASAPLG